MGDRDDQYAFGNLLERLLHDESFDREGFVAEADGNQEAVAALDALLDASDPNPASAISPDIVEDAWQDLLRLQRQEGIREGWMTCRATFGDWYERACRQIADAPVHDFARNPPAVMARLLSMPVQRAHARTTVGVTGGKSVGLESLLETERWLRQEADDLLRAADALFAPIPRAVVERYLAVVVRELRFQSPALEGCFVTDGSVGGIVVNADSQYHSTRRFYTWAHEIGHHVLHRGTPGEFRDDKKTLRDIEAGVEAEANIFASSLLMPQSLLLSSYHPSARPTITQVNAIASRFQVSPLAAMFRIVRVTERPCALAVFEDGRLDWSMPSPALVGELLSRGAPPPLESVTKQFVDMETHSQQRYHKDGTSAEGWLRQGSYSFADESCYRASPRHSYTLLTFHD